MAQQNPSQYRKKPVIIEAMQLTRENQMDVSLWCSAVVHYDEYLTIYTLEGTHRADFGDWIIKGVKGEFYPCKPDIFEMTYEPWPAAGVVNG